MEQKKQKKKIQYVRVYMYWHVQTNVHVYYIRPDHVKQSTQQNLCKKYRAASFECNDELLLTLFHKSYIRCVKLSPPIKTKTFLKRKVKMILLLTFCIFLLLYFAFDKVF